MFETDLEYIYVTRDSFSDGMDAWDPNVGIKKFKGSQYFCSARSPNGDRKFGVGILAYYLKCKDLGLCRIIPRGTAWLVEVGTGVWERVDQNMALLSGETGRPVG